MSTSAKLPGMAASTAATTPFNVSSQSGPLLIADNHKRDVSAFQVLLVTDVFVGRQQ